MIIRALFVFLLACFFLPNLAAATTFRLCPDCENSDLKKTIFAMSANDTLRISYGIYEVEELHIDKAICIIGEGLPEFKAVNGKAIMVVTSDSFSITGCHFSGVETNYLVESAALRMRQAKDFYIGNNIFEECFFAIYLEKSRKGIIEYNTIKGKAVLEASSGNGVHAWYCEDLSIVGNEISRQRDGIYFEFVTNSRINKNRSHNNLRYGLHFMFSNNNGYEGNHFQNNGAGVAVMFSKNIDMVNNAFIENVGASSYGLLLKEIYDATIENNAFIDNTLAVFVEGSTRILYKSNRFSGNGRAMQISGGCLNNTVVGNSFESNTSDIMVQNAANENSFDSNFWSKYGGYDLNKDGIGDVPHRPVSLFSYLVNRCPESMLLSRSMFVSLLDFAEKVNPDFTPEQVFDHVPLMKNPLDRD